jgi:hypothetical protein
MTDNKIFKKVVLLSLLIFSVQNIAFSQSIDDIFSRSGKKIVWLGLDFTQVKIVGPLGTVDKQELIPLFDDMNRLVISERTKYNFEAALRKDEVPYDLEVVTSLNSALDPGKAIAYASSNAGGRLNEEAISVLVKQYKVENPEGIGLVFFVETLDKVKEKGTMWVTFFNLADRNVLFTEKMSGVAGGISFRNHWLRPVYEVIDQIRNSRYAEWRFRFVN